MNICLSNVETHTHTNDSWLRFSLKTSILGQPGNYCQISTWCAKKQTNKCKSRTKMKLSYRYSVNTNMGKLNLNCANLISFFECLTIVFEELRVHCIIPLNISMFTIGTLHSPSYIILYILFQSVRAPNETESSIVEPLSPPLSVATRLCISHDLISKPTFLLNMA